MWSFLFKASLRGSTTKQSDYHANTRNDNSRHPDSDNYRNVSGSHSTN